MLIYNNVVIRGAGKLFYQNGIPLSIIKDFFESKGISLSIFHVADECMRNGWSAKTTIRKIKEELDREVNEKELSDFCNAEYEDQREMIFKQLFNNEKEALEALRNIL